MTLLKQYVQCTLKSLLHYSYKTRVVIGILFDLTCMGPPRRRCLSKAVTCNWPTLRQFWITLCPKEGTVKTPAKSWQMQRASTLLGEGLGGGFEHWPSLFALSRQSKPIFFHWQNMSGA